MTHILVAVGAHPKMNVLLNAAARQAQELGLPWHVVYVETPTHLLRGDTHQQLILRHITKAEEMGAIIHRVEAQDIMQGLLSYFERLDEAPIECWMGKPAEGIKESFFSRPLFLRLLEVIPDNVTLRPVPLHGRDLSADRRIDVFRLRAVKFKHLLCSLLSVFVALGLTEAMRATMSAAEFSISSYNLSLLFIVPPIVMGLRFGLIPALVAALGGYLTLNYFYIEPIYQLDITDYHGMVNGLLFFAIAIAMALIGSYSYAYASSIQRREKRTQALFAINDVISRSMSRQEALESIHQQISNLLEMEVALFLPYLLNPQELELSYPSSLDSLDEYDWEALKECWMHIRPSGCGTSRFARSPWRFCPMMTGKDRFGVLAIRIPPKYDLDATFGLLMTALADQAANVLERIELTKEVEARHISEEREKLRAMLLSSISHDLKTPLASVIGSLSVYHGMYDNLPDEQKRELTETALQEAQRLDSFITNILDMTRIESGQLQFKQEWLDPTTLVKTICKRLKQPLRHHHVQVNMEPKSVMIKADPVMTEQILQNLFDNASKYTPSDGTIYVEYEEQDTKLHLMIRDTGPGIPKEKLERIFDKYERIHQQDRKVAGTGLGLAIAKAVMEAQGGQVTVSNHSEGGAVFTLIFPTYEIDKKGEQAIA